MIMGGAERNSRAFHGAVLLSRRFLTKGRNRCSFAFAGWFIAVLGSRMFDMEVRGRQGRFYAPVYFTPVTTISVE
jgi:hypothetical protein